MAKDSMLDNCCLKKRTSRLWFLWKLWFPGADYRKVYIAFGSFISSPGNSAPKDILAHEYVHLKQQRFSFLYSLWWHLKYRASSNFRMDQEIEAYKAQLWWFERNTSFNQAYKARLGVAKLLASPMYGFKITVNEAFEKLG